MLAKDIMTTPAIAVAPEATTREIAIVLLERRISAVPVIDTDAKVLGMVSESDLMHSPKTGGERPKSWWLSLIAGPEDRARDVMTTPVRTVTEDAALKDIAAILERLQIKRVPVVNGDKIVGIVSRANLLHGLVASNAEVSPSLDDHAMREAFLTEIQEAGVREDFISVIVAGGKVHIWGTVESDTERKALDVAAENIAGVKGSQNEVNVLPPSTQTNLWI